MPTAALWTLDTLTIAKGVAAHARCKAGRSSHELLQRVLMAYAQKLRQLARANLVQVHITHVDSTHMLFGAGGQQLELPVEHGDGASVAQLQQLTGVKGSVCLEGSAHLITEALEVP